MIKEAYCSFEVAKLLKEKGFPMREHSMMYTNKNNVCLTESAMRQHLSREDYLHFGDFFIPTVTCQMAMMWLREVHGIYIVFFYINKSGWWYNIIDMRDSYVFYSSEIIMCSYEEVVDLAIKYTLENLI